jgi:dTDP-4-amino-4,6-dideoxygalactose transaminase
MSDWHKRRKANAHAIIAAAEFCPALRVPKVSPDCEHAWYRCYVFVRPERLRIGWTRDKIVESITAAGVPCFQGSCSEIYLESAFAKAGLQPAEPLPVARELGETSMAFLVHPTLKEHEVEKAANVLMSVMSAATA